MLSVAWLRVGNWSTCSNSRNSLRRVAPLVLLCAALAEMTPARKAVPQAAASQTLGDTTITIRALSSTLEFVPASISVKTGRRLRLRFTNDGTLPHNFVLAKRDDDIDEIAVAAYQAAESGFVPPSVRDKLIAWTRLASPGETVEVEFVVPAPGSYTYICLFPGHAASMLGTLRALR